jgi:DNA-binding IclR family transcriptional regulator
MSNLSNPSGTQAVDRAARLLSEVVHSASPVTFTELTVATGLAKSTTSRLLLALERNGLVRRDGQGRFLPGEMFVSFAWRGGADSSLVAVAQPFMDQLGRSTGETINLGIASGSPGEGQQAETIAQVDCAYLIGGTNWVGLSVPLHASALGKVLLAYNAAQLPSGGANGVPPRTPRGTLDDGASPGTPRTPASISSAQLPPGPGYQGALPKVTGKTITSEAALRAELAQVRARGYAVSDEELEPGLIAIAAPVFRYDGTVVAAMSVSAPTSRMKRDTATAVARRCVEETAGLSAALGYRPRARKGA